MPPDYATVFGLKSVPFRCLTTLKERSAVNGKLELFCKSVVGFRHTKRSHMTLR